MSNRREWELIYEKHPKLSALSRVTHARESVRPSWRGGRHFHKAECLPLLRSSIKLNVCMRPTIYDGMDGVYGDHSMNDIVQHQTRFNNPNN